MRLDETCKIKKTVPVTHPLLVMIWNMMRLCNQFQSMPVTHHLFVIEWDIRDCMHGKTKMQCHSHAVFHGMRLSETGKRVTSHPLLAMGWEIWMSLEKEQNAVSLTYCWLWDETWSHGKGKKQWLSQAVGQGMILVKTPLQRKDNAVSLTYCWAWDVIDETAL